MSNLKSELRKQYEKFWKINIKRLWNACTKSWVITFFTVFRLLTDFVCLHTYKFWLYLWKIVRSSVILLLPLFRQYFSYIVTISFIGGENRRTRRKPSTCRKSLTNFIAKCCIQFTSPLGGFYHTTLVVIGTDCTGSWICHTITTTTTPSFLGLWWGQTRRIYTEAYFEMILSVWFLQPY